MDQAPTPDVTGWNTGSSDQVSTRNGRSLSDPRSWMLLGAVVLLSGMLVLGGLYRLLTGHSSWSTVALLAIGVLGFGWITAIIIRRSSKRVR